MSFSGTKSHHFITTAILVSALTLCWSAEAAHRSKSANRYISVYISRGDPAVVICYAINKSTRKISAVFDIYNLAAVWFWFSIPPPVTRIERLIWPGIQAITWVPAPAKLGCTLVSARWASLVRPEPSELS